MRQIMITRIVVFFACWFIGCATGQKPVITPVDSRTQWDGTLFVDWRGRVVEIDTNEFPFEGKGMSCFFTPPNDRYATDIEFVALDGNTEEVFYYMKPNAHGLRLTYGATRNENDVYTINRGDIIKFPDRDNQSLSKRNPP